MHFPLWKNIVGETLPKREQFGDFGGTLELRHHSILASAFKEIITCCDLNIGNKTVRMTGDLAAALRGGLFSHTCFLSFPQLPQARGVPKTGHEGSQKGSIREEMLFYPETLHIRKVWFSLELCCVLGVWMLAAGTSWEPLLLISGISHPLAHTRKSIS